MFDNYLNTFEQRGELYNAATQMCPYARDAELKQLLNRLALRGARTVCDIPAGGGYVADGIRATVGDSIRVVCVDASWRFAAGIADRHDTVVARHGAIPLAAGSMDRVASLAGLHHLTDVQPFFDEAARILSHGGRMVVGDVQAETPPARFLNGAVNRLTETGHQGRFFVPGQPAALIERAGLTCIDETLCAFTWDFTNIATLVRYCRLLFGMVKAIEAEVEAEIRAVLPVEEAKDGTARLHWSLLYAVGIKP